jgi:hypothetical protein
MYEPLKATLEENCLLASFDHQRCRSASYPAWSWQLNFLLDFIILELLSLFYAMSHPLSSGKFLAPEIVVCLYVSAISVGGRAELTQIGRERDYQMHDRIWQ